MEGNKYEYGDHGYYYAAKHPHMSTYATVHEPVHLKPAQVVSQPHDTFYLNPQHHLSPKTFVHEHRFEPGHETHYPLGALHQPAAYHHIERAVQGAKYPAAHVTHPEL